MIKSIRYSTSPDYTKNSYFPFYNTEKIYNSILIPKSILDNFNDLMVGKEIYIWYEDKKTRYKIIYFCDNITLDNKEYLLFYISRGISIDNLFFDSKRYSIEYKNHKYDLDLLFNLRKSTPKLFMGILVLDNLYDFAFKHNDSLLLKINDNYFTNLKADKVVSSYNVYSPLSSATTVFLNLADSLDGLTELHSSYDTQTLSLRSLTTKRIKQKGQLLVWISGAYKLNISNNFDYNQMYSFHNYISIQNLDSGVYTLQFFDKNNNLVELYNNGVVSNILNIEIVDFRQKENTIILNNTKNANSGQSQFLPRL